MLGKWSRLAPCGLATLQGQKLMAASRGFVRFLTESKVALGYYNWLKNTDTPEEHFYATMATLNVEAVINLNNGKIRSDDLSVLVECIFFSVAREGGTDQRILFNAIEVVSSFHLSCARSRNSYFWQALRPLAPLWRVEE